MAGFSVNSPKARKSDQELVAGVLEDKKQFAAIVQRYEEPLFRYIVRQGARDRELARDILQEVFIKVYLHLNDYDASLPFSSWIYRIAHNETITHFRKEKNRPLVLDKGDDDEFSEKSLTISNSPGPTVNMMSPTFRPSWKDSSHAIGIFLS